MRGIHVVMVDCRLIDIYTEDQALLGRIRAAAREFPIKEVESITWHFGRPSWDKQEVA